MHDWSSDWNHFGEVGEAANYISTFCRRWGRMGGQSKEKYGTVRFYGGPHGIRSLMDITHPGYVSYLVAGYPKWLSTFDIMWMSRFFGSKLFHPVQLVVYKWQSFVYKKAYSNAVKKWPMIREEILSCADHLELLDDADDMKLDWRPPSFSEKDRKRIGTRVLDKIEELRKEIDNNDMCKIIIDKLVLEGRLTEEELKNLNLYVKTA